MAPRKPDHPLRRALAELRRMRIEDRDAIFDLLEPADRLRVERRLQGTAMRPEQVSSGHSASFAGAGYSDWLLARLDMTKPGAMTTAAAALLRECALGQQDPNAAVSDGKDTPLTGRLTALLRRRQA